MGKSNSGKAVQDMVQLSRQQTVAPCRRGQRRGQETVRKHLGGRESLGPPDAHGAEDEREKSTTNARSGA